MHSKINWHFIYNNLIFHLKFQCGICFPIFGYVHKKFLQVFKYFGGPLYINLSSDKHIFYTNPNTSKHSRLHCIIKESSSRSQPRPPASVTAKRPGRESGGGHRSWTRGTTNIRRTCGSNARAYTRRRRKSTTNIRRTQWTAAAGLTTPCRGSNRLGRPICLCVSFINVLWRVDGANRASKHVVHSTDMQIARFQCRSFSRGQYSAKSNIAFVLSVCEAINRAATFNRGKNSSSCWGKVSMVIDVPLQRMQIERICDCGYCCVRCNEGIEMGDRLCMHIG